MASTSSSSSSSNSTSKLFQPIKVGRVELAHRIAMAPLTRFRADDEHVPLLPMVKEYYAQRTAVPGSLVVTEATFISRRAGGYDSAPGIYSAEQIRAWRQVTDAVHANRSSIFLQLWALGRAANAETLRRDGGHDVVSAGDVPMAADGAAAVPRPLREDEIAEYVADYARAAANAVHEAGFDGVEIHAANGYLVDQFLQDVSNNRSDGWGGSVEARARFALEVTAAVVAAVGADRTAIRLSPWSTFQGMRMADPVPQFRYLAERLRPLGLAYVHLVESRPETGLLPGRTEELDFFLEAYADASPVLVANGYTADLAREAVDGRYRRWDVVVVFGRHYISTPDLPFRVRQGLAFNKYERDGFYTPRTERGYTDYPFSEQFRQIMSKA
ncbi:hypothetical protein CDD83_4573 [Cordyceps sp. RAO-2017]|nr:hypothetical protein CDD83_4573 [Cordyceps sp. RAO-2017]